MTTPQSNNELVLSIPVGTRDALHRGELRDPETVWIELFRNARTSIDLAQFYVTSSPNSAIDRVIDALEEAKDRGVKIRFFVDGGMAKTTATEDDGGVDRLRHILGDTNFRMFTAAAQATVRGVHHAKYIIVDGAIAYIGSQNFDWRALDYIHEIGVLTTDPAIVQPLTAIFAHDWRTTEGDAQMWWKPEPLDAPSAKSDGRTMIVASPTFATPSGIESAEEELLYRIINARKSIAVELMSYSAHWPEGAPYLLISNALRDAVARGVDVRLLVDQSKVIKAFGDLRSLADDGVAVRAVTIPAPQPIPHAWLIHAKIMVVDDEVLWVGTSNWSPEYFNDQRNIELIFNDADLAAQGLMLYNDLWNSPYAADLATTPPPTPAK